MKKVVRLTERQLQEVIRKVINEQVSQTKPSQGKNFVEKFPQGNVEYKLPRIKSTDDVVDWVNWFTPHGSTREAYKWLLDPKGGGLCYKKDAFGNTRENELAIWQLFNDAMEAVARTGIVGSVSAYNGPEFRKVLRGIAQGTAPGGRHDRGYDSEAIINGLISGINCEDPKRTMSSFGHALKNVVKAMG